MDSIRTERSCTVPLLAQAGWITERIFMRGVLPAQAMTAEDARAGSGYIYMTVVGSRKYTSYGREACETLIKGLRGLPVVIVSGLALGIDSIAHRAALDAGLKTVAIPGSGIDDESMYPASHLGLAHDIIDSGGTVVSPFPPGTRGAPWTFPQRNLLMAAISHATLVIEADVRSGTLITSKRASDCSRDVLAVPGSIFSSQSSGPHQLIRDGATPITSVADLRQALGFPDDSSKNALSGGAAALRDGLSGSERRILNGISAPKSIDELVDELRMSAEEVAVALSRLEMKGLAVRSGGRARIAG